MRIEINKNKELLVAVSNEDLNNDNFVDLEFGDESVTVSLDDLFSAFIAFDSLRSRRLSRDKDYGDID